MIDRCAGLLGLLGLLGSLGLLGLLSSLGSLGWSGPMEYKDGCWILDNSKKECRSVRSILK